jgi:glycosyltransferase involved in cell wall biosynthesis/uncharacterized protein (DUF1919 family)
MQRNSEHLVSVIVPIYNTEVFLGQCVDSILNQTYANLEIILVDDCTPDSAGEIAEQYAVRDSRVKVIHKPFNEGLNMARATGFEASTGECVTFVDSDDLLVDDCIEYALGQLMAKEVDFVRFNMRNFWGEEGVATAKNNIPKNAQNEAIISNTRDLIRTQIWGIPGFEYLHAMTVWGALYKREIVSKIDWKAANYRVYEDNFWSLQLHEYVESAFYTDKVGYLYRNNDNYTEVLSKSVTGNSLNGQPIGYLEFLDRLTAEFQRISDQYGLKLDTEIEEYKPLHYTNRMLALHKAHALDLENNAQYLPKVIPFVITRFEREYNLSGARHAHINYIEEQLAVAQAELASHMGIKRALKLLIGNIKRRILRCVQPADVNARRTKYIAKLRKRYQGGVDVTIISRNCIGGMIYADLGLKFNSPTINLWFTPADFRLLVDNLEEFCTNGKLTKLDGEEKDVDYPVGKLCAGGKSVRINFMHYTSFDEAASKWYQRSSRVDFSKIIVVDELTDGADQEHLQWFSSLKYPKLLYSNLRPTQEYPFIKYSRAYEDYYPGKLLEYPDETATKRYYQEVDFVSAFS